MHNRIWLTHRGGYTFHLHVSINVIILTRAVNFVLEPFTSVQSWATIVESESESEMFLFDPYQKYIQSNNETILDQGTPIKTSLVANIRAAYYIINNYFFISQAKNT